MAVATPTHPNGNSHTANGFEKIQYSNFYAGVGYTPLVDPGADAQTFRESSELCHHPSPIRETETVPRGKILANGFPGGVYESFHDGIGYVPCTDVGADAQKFTPADVLMDHS